MPGGPWCRTWIALNDSASEFSLQNCKMILITLQGTKEREQTKRLSKACVPQRHQAAS